MAKPKDGTARLPEAAEAALHTIAEHEATLHALCIAARPRLAAVATEEAALEVRKAKLLNDTQKSVAETQTRHAREKAEQRTRLASEFKGKIFAVRDEHKKAVTNHSLLIEQLHRVREQVT
jgi:hypothetical protein